MVVGSLVLPALSLSENVNDTFRDYLSDVFDFHQNQF